MENLKEYITNPFSLGRHQADSLEALREKYPYFQALHILIAKCHKNQNTFGFIKNLKLASLYAGDRKVFYTFINSEPEPTEQTTIEKVAEMPDATVEEITETIKPETETIESPLEKIKASIAEDEMDGSSLDILSKIKPPEKISGNSDMIYPFTWDEEPDNAEQLKRPLVENTPWPEKKPIFEVVNKHERKEELESKEAENNTSNTETPPEEKEKISEIEEPGIRQEILNNGDLLHEKEIEETGLLGSKIEIDTKEPLLEIPEEESIEEENTVIEVLNTRDVIAEELITEPEINEAPEESEEQAMPDEIPGIEIIEEETIQTEPAAQLLPEPVELAERIELKNTETENEFLEIPEKLIIEEIGETQTPLEQIREDISEKEQLPVSNNLKEPKTNEQDFYGWLDNFATDETKKPEDKELIPENSLEIKTENPDGEKDILAEETKIEPETFELNAENITVNLPLNFEDNEDEEEFDLAAMAEIAYDIQAFVKHPEVEEKEIHFAPKQISKHEIDDLLDKFIKKNPSISRPKAEFYKPENMAKKSEEFHGEVVSETLAQLFYRQGHLHKALEMYEKLMLQNPDKKDNFAARIKSIKEELINQL